jgi:hypothetical protein
MHLKRGRVASITWRASPELYLVRTIAATGVIVAKIRSWRIV